MVGFLAGRSADALGVSIRTRDVISGLVIVALGVGVVALGVETSVPPFDVFGALFALLGAYTLFRAYRGAPLSAA